MRKTILLSIAVIAVSVSAYAQSQTITTIAGNGVSGYSGDNGAATSAHLFGPTGVILDGAGNMYIADAGNNCIRKVNTSGVITTIAGTGVAGYSGDNGIATSATLNDPTGVAVDGAGNVYIADRSNHCVRKVDNAGIITTFAGSDTSGFSGDHGPAKRAKMKSPYGIAVSHSGNVFISDQSDSRIRKVDTGGIITTIAGTGTPSYNGDSWPSATMATLNSPSGLAIDSAGNLYFADRVNQRIRKIDTFNTISTICGGTYPSYSGENGLATNALLNFPVAVAVDGFGNVYISDEVNYRIRKIEHATGTIRSIVGNGSTGFSGDNGPANYSRLGDVKGMTADKNGVLYLADWPNNRIRHVNSGVGVKAVSAATSAMNIFPNPGSGSFTFSITSEQDEPVNVIITNIKGERVHEFSATTNLSKTISLDLPTGLYFVSTSTAGETWSSKLEIIAK